MSMWPLISLTAAFTFCLLSKDNRPDVSSVGGTGGEEALLVLEKKDMKKKM